MPSNNDKRPIVRNIPYYRLRILLDCESCFYYREKHGIERKHNGIGLDTKAEEWARAALSKFRGTSRLPKILRELKDEGWRVSTEKLASRFKRGMSVRHTTNNGNHITFPCHADDVLVKDTSDNSYEVCVVDYKGLTPNGNTSKNIKKAINLAQLKLQLSMYSTAAKVHRYNVVDYGYLVFFYIGEGNNPVIRSKLKKVDLYTDKELDDILDRADHILNLERAPSIDKPCPYCMSAKQRVDLKSKESAQPLIARSW